MGKPASPPRERATAGEAKASAWWGATALKWIGGAAAVAAACLAGRLLPQAPQEPDVQYADPLSPEVVELQDKAAGLRRRLESGSGGAGIAEELEDVLADLHALHPFRGLGALNASRTRYGTSRLLGDASAITGYQRGMLLHGSPVQILDVPSLALPAPGVEGHWAAYNPSVVPVTWAGHSALLVIYRLSTWNLCTWAADGSPLERLPVVKGKKRTTSKAAAAILRPDFSVAVPLHHIAGTNYSSHYCTHHSGMIRMGIDDGRLFLIDREPFMLYAAVAPEDHHSHCFHNVMLCSLELPPDESEKVRCKGRVRLRYDRADEISERHRAAGRLANVHQKNWVPFVLDGTLYLIFTIEPLVVVRVDRSSGACTEISEARARAMSVFYSARGSEDEHSTMGVHGGSPLIPLPSPNAGEFLGIGRTARGNTQYALFFYTVSRSQPSLQQEEGSRAPTGFKMVSVSPIFCFASTSPHHRGLCETIQFAGGLVLGGTVAGEGNLVVSYGANDCEGKVAVLPLQRVLGLLKPAGRKAARSRSA